MILEASKRFKAQIRGIPGYPRVKICPSVKWSLKSGALWRLPDLLSLAGMNADQRLLVVMDRTPMQREGRDLKELILQILKDASWQSEVIWLEPDSTGQVHTDFTQINFIKAHLQANSAVSVGGLRDSHRCCQACLLCLSAGTGYSAPPLCRISNGEQRQCLHIEHGSNFCGWCKTHPAFALPRMC